jgi:hypothetical protein
MKRSAISRLGLISVVSIGLTLSFSACDGGSWTNWFQTESVTPEVLSAPKNARELVDTFKKASHDGKRVRMTGNGHAASDIAITTDVLLTPQNLNQPLTLDYSRLRGPHDPSLVRFEGGINIFDLNTYLDQHGRALFNMGGFDGQTYAGVMMTATHGSGLAYGPMADDIASLQMVMDRGQVVQIEPSNGITDPSKFPGVLEEDPNIPVQLIQDDDAFNAARVSIGSMGVVYSVVLRTDKKFWLKEVRHLISWSDLKKPGGYLDRATHGLPIYGEGQPSPEHWELQFSPYVNDQGDHTFLITDRYRSYTPLPEQDASHRGEALTNIITDIVVLLANPIADVIDVLPEIAKPMLQGVLSAEVETSFTNVSYRVFNIGAVNNAPALGIEAAFDLHDIVAGIERSFKLNEDLLAHGMPLTSPMAMRLVKKTDALIGMQNGRDTAFIEMISLRAGRYAKTILKTNQKTYMAEFGARPHWGLDLKLLTSDAQVQALYPDTWERWKSEYLRFNPNGTTDGNVTDRLGISVHPRPVPAVNPDPIAAPVAKLDVPLLASDEAAQTVAQRRVGLQMFLEAVDGAIAGLAPESARAKMLVQLRGDVLKRNADIAQ